MRTFAIWLSSMWDEWWYLMGSAAFTFISFVLTFLPPTTDQGTWFRRVSILLAVVFFVCAAYRSWLVEHRLLKGERAKNARPDVYGEIVNIVGDGEQEPYEKIDPLSKEPYCSFGVVFHVKISNRSPAETNIIAIELDSTAVRVPITFALLNGLIGTKLQRGIGGTYLLYARATFSGATLADVKNIDLQRIKLYITDGFDDKHEVLYIHATPFTIFV